MIGLPYVERGELRPDQLQEALPMGLFPRAFLRIITDHIATSPLTRPDVHLLHPQIGRHVAVAAWTREDFPLDLGDLAHRHRQEVSAQGSAQSLPIGLGEHPAIAD